MAAALLLALAGVVLAVFHLRRPPDEQGTSAADPGTAPPAALATSVPSGTLAYRDRTGVLVAHDLASGAVTPIPPPTAAVEEYAVSADLTTYAWIERTSPDPADAVLMLKRGQAPAAMLLDLRVLSRSLHWTREYEGLWLVALSRHGSLVALGPTYYGGNTVHGVFVASTRDGRVVLAGGCELVPGASVFDPSGAFVAGIVLRSPRAAESSRVIETCALDGDGKRASDALNRAVAERNRVPPSGSVRDERDYDVGYFVAGAPSWGPPSAGSPTIVFARRRYLSDRARAAAYTTAESDALKRARPGERVISQTIEVVTSRSARTLYATAAVLSAADGAWAEVFRDATLSPDGQWVAAQIDRVPVASIGSIGDRSIWLISSDGAATRRIEGEAPFWIVPPRGQ